MPRRLTFRQRLDRYPPILLRLLVTRGGRSDRLVPTVQAAWVPTDRQLAQSCGLSMAELKFVSYSTSWADIPNRIAAAYMAGCGVDLESRRCFRRLEWMRRRGRFGHLRKSPEWPQFAEMLEIWEESER